MSEKALDFQKAPIDKVKNVLCLHHAYVQLLSSLMPNCLTNSKIKRTMLGLGDWMQSADENEIRCKAPTLIEMFDKAIEILEKHIRPKRPSYEIAYDYYSICRDKSFSWSTGLRYDWLAARFDCSALGVPEDMPHHARIGIGPHAGRAAIEEDFLLRDAFFILVKARRALQRMNLAGEEAKTRADPQKLTGQLSRLNENVATYARLAVFSFYSFVECFVNSVGEDFILRSTALPPDEKALLRGLKNGRYVSIEKKIEKFPSIIRADKRSPLVLSDPAQLVEPFASFVRIVKSIRDAATHYAKQKAEIWRVPAEWVDIANAACKTCIRVARQFWETCYPERPHPKYLGGLDETKHIVIAERSVELEEMFQ